MSSQKGNASRSRRQKHQNTVAYKNDKYGASVQVKIANSKVHDGLCKRCKEVIEWKVKYNKYKSLTQPRTCVKCSQKTVKDAYHVICKPCAIKLELCAKCGKKEDIVIPVNSQKQEDETEEDLDPKKAGHSQRENTRDVFDSDDEFGDLGSDEDFAVSCCRRNFTLTEQGIAWRCQDFNKRSRRLLASRTVPTEMSSSNESTVGIANVYRGTFVHSTDDTPLEILEDTLVGVDADGKIAFIGSWQEVDSLSRKWGFVASTITHLGQHEFFMPGLVDTHIHASQYGFAGTALDMPLLEWLNTYTFPEEERYKDPAFARNVYTHVVKRTLRNGTTTACYFATIHTDASLLLCEIANDFGQRALVGKVCMDRNNSYPNYKESLDESQKETIRFIDELLKKKYPLVKPVVTPRFALSCSTVLLDHLGKIAQDNHLHIQSHISETKEEVERVKDLFPTYDSYTDVYNKHKLLTDKTVMAHGCHLTDEELKLFRETGASIAHCPNSNISLCSGMLDVRRVLNQHVKLGLGTDVAGGYSPSMLDAVRKTMDTTKALKIQDPENYQTLTFEEVFQLATLGGSQALSLDRQIGNFEVGKDFDALRVNTAKEGGPIDLIILCKEPKVLLEKFLNLGDDRNIVEVYVAGKRVVPFVEKPVGGFSVDL
ncbi:hypothetical protein DPEC_G00123810 [Dallia pectoralis]|uniref:Uncharacterized protein n=1 Tax=Dallia pectoralis TaxID=75939 RepID=A0ACC2GQS3_DALPE|nr:hypothetical protein DPEC_G00123810 [Dallia pectoralis]